MTQKKRAPKTGHNSKVWQRNNQNQTARRAADVLKIFKPNALACILPYETENPPARQKYLIYQFKDYRRKCEIDFRKIGKNPFMFWTSYTNAAERFCHVLIIDFSDYAAAADFLKSNWIYGTAQIFTLKNFPFDIVNQIKEHQPNGNKSWNSNRKRQERINAE